MLGCEQKLIESLTKIYEAFLLRKIKRIQGKEKYQSLNLSHQSLHRRNPPKALRLSFYLTSVIISSWVVHL